MACCAGKLLLLLSVILYMTPELCDAQGIPFEWFAKQLGHSRSGSQEEVVEKGEEELSKFVRRRAE